MSHSPEELVAMSTPRFQPQLSLGALEELAHTLDLLVVGALFGHQDRSNLEIRLRIGFFYIQDSELGSCVSSAWNIWRASFEGKFNHRWTKFHPLHEKVLRMLIKLGRIVEDSEKMVERFLGNLGDQGNALYVQGNIAAGQAMFDRQRDLMTKLGVVYPNFQSGSPQSASGNHQIPRNRNPQFPGGNPQVPRGQNPQIPSGNPQIPSGNPQNPRAWNSQFPSGNPQPLIRNPRFSIPNPQSVPNPQLSPQSLVRNPRFSIPIPQSVPNPQISIPNSQFSIADPQFFIADPQFPIADSQFPIEDFQFPIEDPQSPTADPQEET
ncbi:Protein transport protein Sec16B [Lobaria immixta]|nr:Protein transport protein Sec16B [Lobaria immixta]